MGTVCEIVLDGDATPAIVAFDEIARIEQMLSTWRDGSELSRLNRSQSAEVSRELFAVLSDAIRSAEATGGAFNPLTGPLVELWRTREQGLVPTPEAIANILPLANLEGPRFDAGSRRVSLPAGSAFEEGGFGKGYALDRAAAVLEEAGKREFLLDFGGQLMLRSSAPIDVAIASPEHRDEPLLLLTMTSGSLSTSSGSEKTFVVDGVRFSHILDPRDGRALPSRGSVSVVSSSAFEADVLSTALYVMGPREGLAWANAHDVAAIFIVPTEAGWKFLLSDKSNTAGLAVRAAGTEFKQGEKTQ
ncbi:MAG: FAD:protein FMN transferase [Acidobacteria bacterium]|nr:FAD:protein FMN transferase [Acidobacteriota bacterium]